MSQSNDRGQPGRTRAPRARDIERVRNFKDQQATTWSDKMEVSDKAEELKEKEKPRGTKKNKPQPKIFKPSTTETKPQDGALYDGSGLGSSPMLLQATHNFDYAAYPVLIRTVYDYYTAMNAAFSRSMPFAMWQHACVELLNASIYSQIKLNTADPLLAYHPDPILALNLAEVQVPLPILEYIRHATMATTPTGELIAANMPARSFPSGPIPHDADHDYIASGSFGPVDAASHNLYEAYISPFVTRRLIEQTIAANTLQPGNTDQSRAAYNRRFDEWNPLPRGYYPEGASPTPNLLGYALPERLHPQALQELENVQFTDDDTILGRLSHSAYALTRFSEVVRSNSSITSAPFSSPAYSSTPAVFVIKECEEVVPSNLCLALRNASLHSPFAFAANTSNMAILFGYKRMRTELAAGYCYLNAGNAIEGWDLTINSNYNMVDPFIPRNMLTDRIALRQLDHREQMPVCEVTAIINQWITRHMVTT